MTTQTPQDGTQADEALVEQTAAGATQEEVAQPVVQPVTETVAQEEPAPAVEKSWPVASADGESRVQPAAAPVEAPAPAPVAAVQEPVLVAHGFDIGSAKITEQTHQLLSRLVSETPLAAGPFHQLFAYLNTMQPGKVMDPVAGARQQVALYRTMQTILKSTVNFQLAFTCLLRVVMDNDQDDGAFGDRYIFRFFDNISLTTQDQHGLRHLINVLKIAAPVPDRASRLQHSVNVAVALQHSLDDESRRRVLQYLGL